MNREEGRIGIIIIIRLQYTKKPRFSLSHPLSCLDVFHAASLHPSRVMLWVRGLGIGRRGSGNGTDQVIKQAVTELKEASFRDVLIFWRRLTVRCGGTADGRFVGYGLRTIAVMKERLLLIDGMRGLTVTVSDMQRCMRLRYDMMPYAVCTRTLSGWVVTCGGI